MVVRRALAWRDARSTASPFILGCIAATLILVRPFDAALTLPIVSIYLLAPDWPRVWSTRRNSNFARFLIPVAVSVALFGLYNDLRFGSPTVFNESTGFGTPFRIGLYGLLLSVRRGIIFFSPPVVATVPGSIKRTLRRFGEGLFCGSYTRSLSFGLCLLFRLAWRFVLGAAFSRAGASLYDSSLG